MRTLPSDMIKDADDGASSAAKTVQMKGENWYDHPKWYDILHARGTAAEVSGVETIAERFAGWVREDGYLNLLEPACGTARHLRVAARRGHSCWGMDRSAVMLEYAGRKLDEAGLRASLLEMDMARFGIADLGLGHKRIDVAFCFINSLRHLPTDDAMVSHLTSVRRVLGPKGVYAVGIGLAAYGSEQESEDVWKGSRGRCSVTQMVQYMPPPNLVLDGEGELIEPQRNERVISQLAIRTPQREVFVSHSFSLRTYNAEEWERVVASAGMRVVGLVDEFGDDLDWDWRSGTPGYAVFVLRAGGSD